MVIKMIDIQEIIEEHLERIIELIKNDIPQKEQEPDYVIMKELKKYFR
jgi:hypothetical protein